MANTREKQSISFTFARPSEGTAVCRRMLSSLTLFAIMLVFSGCSIQRFAADRLGDAMAEGGASVFATDDDPELIGAALPFSLKTIEMLLAQSPHNKKLLMGATSGFTQYAYAYVQNDADMVEDTDLTRATALRERAVKLYRRALAYGIRGLEETQPRFAQLVRTDPETALAPFKKGDVPLLYWTAAAWGAAISLDKTNAALSADLPYVDAIIRRALELDEGFDHGAIHEFLITYEGGRPAAGGGSVDLARRHFERAVQLSGGFRAGPLVAFAETVDVSAQDSAAFRKHLEQALAIDADAVPEKRLANIIAQQRARWLLSRMDRLFLE